MSNAWRLAYTVLQEYITQHPGIEIAHRVIAIPGELRPDFYTLFDRVRSNFVRENLPEHFLTKAGDLSENWAKIRGWVKANLELESIDIETNLRWFLENPMDGLIRRLYDPLFNLLQGKSDLVAFENTSREQVRDAFAQYYHEGYGRWATIALMEMLQPEEIFEVKAPDSFSNVNLSDSNMGISILDGTAPDPSESNSISFIRAPENAFLVPKIIFHSRRLDCFMSLCPDFHQGLWKSRSHSPEQEWLRIADIEQRLGKFYLWPDMAIYTGRDVRGLSLVADYYQIARPEMNIEFRTSADWCDDEGLELINRHGVALQPKRGSFVISSEPEPKIGELMTAEDKSKTGMAGLPSAGKEIMTEIHLLYVGFDLDRLEPLVEALAKRG